MFQALRGRAGHYLLLATAWACLCLVNLGTPSLWDIDEGNNAEAAREMYESGNWIVPTFNFSLRVDKPALLYWLQMLGYHCFGINEFSARLPSALASLGVVLLTYELGRKMFSAVAGLYAGLVLVSSILFCASAHFANPDALLNGCTVLTFLFFWRDWERGGSSWLVLGGISTGLAMLAKGPVGLVLPSSAVLLFLLWSRQLRRYFRRQLVGGMVVFLLVTVPWYAWVAADTKAEFLRGFFLQHNVGRYLAAMENHRGSVLYYLLVLLVGFAPWSVFFAATLWHVFSGGQPARSASEGPASQSPDRYRFLGCWIAVYLAFFTLSRTKLPNYVLPLYPPVALLVAHFLDRWRRGEITPPAWTIHVGLAGLCLTGILTAGGLLVGGGAVGDGLLHGRHLPGLEGWAFLGTVPLLGALAGWWCLRRQQRGGLIAAVALAAVLFTGALIGWASTAVDRHKAPRPLADVLAQHQAEGEVLVGAYRYFQPSLVFYCRQEVRLWWLENEVLDLLSYPIPVYFFMPANVWEELRPKVAGPHRVLGRHHDFYRHCEVVLVTNR
jgi:4-amino-4-deoxy-L-arabinose transferase-like glycosyltransferase